VACNMSENGEEKKPRDPTSSIVAAGNTVTCWTAELIAVCSFRQLCKARCFTRAAMFIDISPNDFNRTVAS
jgi:hypothetical protein